MKKEVKEKIFEPSKLVIPKKLQGKLPYLLKPKGQVLRDFESKTPEIVQKYTAVVMDEEESKIHKTVEMLKTIKEEKRAKDKAAMKRRHQLHDKELAEIEERRKKKRMSTTKSICRKLSKRDMHRVKQAMESIGV